eukprot:s952_g7.t1
MNSRTELFGFHTENCGFHIESCVFHTENCEWHLRHWAGSGDGLGRGWSCVTPRLFCLAGVALGDICLLFVWQAWHLATWTFVLCGRRGTYGTELALVTPLVGWSRVTPRLFCVAGVALGDICLRFVWQAWHLATWTWQAWHLRHWAGSGDGLARGWSSFAWQVWHLVTSAFVLCAALGDMDLTFVWQEWHLRHWAGSGDGLGRGWSPVTPRLFCLAGVALGDICLRFAWQAWHLVTSAFVLRGRRGTWRHGPSFCVAGVVLTALAWLW